MKRKISLYIPVLSMLLLLSGGAAYGQADSTVAVNDSAAINDSIILSEADTTHFSPNLEGGWLLYNSYVSRDVPDSISFEVIVRHDRMSVDWEAPCYIGVIKDSLLCPATDLAISYFLLSDGYEVQVTADGRCYLKLVSGAIPPTDPVIIPIKLKFRAREE